MGSHVDSQRVTEPRVNDLVSWVLGQPVDYMGGFYSLSSRLLAPAEEPSDQYNSVMGAYPMFFGNSLYHVKRLKLSWGTMWVRNILGFEGLDVFDEPYRDAIERVRGVALDLERDWMVPAWKQLFLASYFPGSYKAFCPDCEQCTSAAKIKELTAALPIV